MTSIKLIIACITLLGATSALPSRELNPDTGLDIFGFTQKYGYPLESHEVITDDGYILTLHRIPHGANNTSNPPRGPPVFLMHGLVCSSVDFINMGPGTGLGFILADLGFDVWLGNQRGNTWSRNHTTLNPDTQASEFFSFSWHQIGYYDLPAKIDYILENTGKQKLTFVGHSQANTAFLVMASLLPEYNSKVNLAAFMAPASFMRSLPNVGLRLVADNLALVSSVTESLNFYELLRHTEAVAEISKYLCVDESPVQDACALLVDLIAGFDDQIDPNFLPVINTNTPAGGAFNQLYHYLQGYNSKNFAQFDFGPAENLIKYGSLIPPQYPLNRVTAHVVMYYGGNDALVSVEDVATLNGLLPNVVAKEVPWPQFNHLDFVWAKDVVELLYNDLVAEIQAANP